MTRFLWKGARMTHIPGVLALAVMILASVPSASVSAEIGRPGRIVSINLCADELLMALADADQIAALSPYAVDPTLSFLADEATAFRHDAAEAEIVIDIAPDLILAGRFTKLATRNLLTGLGYRVVPVDAARSIEQSVAQIREIAALVGHPERGETLIGEIETAFASARRAAEAMTLLPSAAVYQRRGYVTGAETLTAELLTAVGLANAGGALAGRTGGFVPLERLVSVRPDYLVVAAPEIPAEDQGTALLSHPVLTQLYPPERRIFLSEKLTVCAGPSLPAALNYLAAEVARITAGK